MAPYLVSVHLFVLCPPKHCYKIQLQFGTQKQQWTSGRPTLHEGQTATARAAWRWAQRYNWSDCWNAYSKLQSVFACRFQQLCKLFFCTFRSSTRQSCIPSDGEKCIFRNGIKYILLQRSILRYWISFAPDLYDLDVQRHLLSTQRNTGPAWSFVICIPYTRCRRYRQFLLQQSTAKNFVHCRIWWGL